MSTNNRRLLAPIAFLVLTLALVVSAQDSLTRDDRVTVWSAEQMLESKLMGRPVPYRIALPATYYENSARRYPVVYLLHGLMGNYKSWSDKTKLGQYVKAQGFIVIMPEGGDSWYTDSISKASDKYESYLVKELMPEVDSKFRTLADRDNRMIAGLSMGGYGAIKLGLKYPEMFSLVGSFSGALGATSFNEKNAGSIGKGLIAIFGPEESETRKANDIFKMIREITAEKLKVIPFIYQSCGTEDFLIGNNRDFLSLLNEKKVLHEYREHPGGHDWRFWDDQVREFLDVAARRLNK